MTESFGDKLTAATPILTIGVGLLALFLNVEWWWLVFAFGWMVATPLVAIIFGDEGESSADDSARADQSVTDREDALDLLRERYAAGELDDVEFERRVERLLETESLDDAAALLETGATGDAEASLERDENVEYER